MHICLLTPSFPPWWMAVWPLRLDVWCSVYYSVAIRSPW